MKFNKWLDALIEEKEIDPQMGIQVEGASGINYMPVQMVIDAIKSTTKEEQSAIKATLVKIDFHTGDIMDFIKHLAQAIAI